MLDRVQLPSAYACAAIGDAAVAVGRAVVDDGWAGVFGMATRPAARGKGAARSVLASLAQWADDHGAARMYLQVERDNVAALALYRQAGFEEVCAYHYRSAAAPRDRDRRRADGASSAAERVERSNDDRRRWGHDDLGSGDVGGLALVRTGRPQQNRSKHG
jgi:N-acetylglutamate synthase-like GNAT family acetyltransferase